LFYGHNPETKAQFLMKTISRRKFVAINTSTFEVKLCATKESLAVLVKRHRNSLVKVKGRVIYGEWMIVPVIEE
jgi:RNase P/RNase MRP subunit p29